MKVFKKQETVLQNMTYMALMAAINVIFVLLTFFVPFLIFLLLFILPLCSAIISYYCKKRYFPFYLVVVISICLLIDFPDTIFYVIPSLITGFIFGICIEWKVPSIYIVVAASIVQFGITLATIPLIDALSTRNIIEDMVSIFHLKSFPYISYLKFSFVFLLSFIQIVLTYIVLATELSKFGMEMNESPSYKFVSNIIGITFALLVIPFAFFASQFAYILMFISLIFALDSLTYIDFSRYKLIFLELFIASFGCLFFIAAFFSRVDSPKELLLFAIVPLVISVIGLLNNYLFIQHNTSKMNN